MAAEVKQSGRWQCRLWWPRHFTVVHPTEPMALIGWASISSCCCLDLVVATACPMPSSSSLETLQEALSVAGKRLHSQIARDIPQAPCVVGQYLPVCSCNDDNEDTKCCGPKNRNDFTCCKSNRREEKRSASILTHCLKCGSSVWAAAVATKNHQGGNVPKLLHVVVEGRQYYASTHVVIYEQPQYGRGHLSCRMWSASAPLAKQTSTRGVMKPEWMVTLAEQQLAPDVERVVEQLNCSAFIGHTVASFLGVSLVNPSLLCNLWWNIIGTLVASVATTLYVLAWACSTLLDKWLCAVPGIGSVQQMSHTWHALHLRCHQLLAWPFILLWGGTGSEQANIAMAHRCAQNRHSTWTAIAVDVVMGAIAGVLVLLYESSIAQFVHRMVRMLTNDIMRTGCIWLMGVPAGFKLNDELATRLGTLALHVIQTWATVGALVKPALRVFLPVLAVFGITMGLTVPVAMLVDTLLLGSIHIAALHQATASLYASQLRALAALWRLFRARKRNPLRGRQDTYECTVEQLVVGSLMFTPLLLLLPTTSVFYTFFTLIYSVLSIVRLCLQYLILILQWFPYAEVALWLLQPKRFPSGVWFKALIADQQRHLGSSVMSATKYLAWEPSSFTSGSRSLWASMFRNGCTNSLAMKRLENLQGRPTTLLSTLGVETASLGELLAPFTEQLGGVCTLRSAVALMYKSVSGGRIPLALELERGAKLPYTSVPMLSDIAVVSVFLTEAIMNAQEILNMNDLPPPPRPPTWGKPHELCHGICWVCCAQLSLKFHIQMYWTGVPAGWNIKSTMFTSGARILCYLSSCHCLMLGRHDTEWQFFSLYSVFIAVIMTGYPEME